MAITTIDYVRYCDVDSPPDMPPGTPLRALLRRWREVDWGVSGATRPVWLSDGTVIAVEAPLSRGGSVAGGQRAVRRVAGNIVRTYRVT